MVYIGTQKQAQIFSESSPLPTPTHRVRNILAKNMDGRRGARSSLGVQSSTLKHSRSVISGVTQPDESLSITGGFFPFKLTATLAALKIVGGCMLIGLGAAAIVQHAGYAGHAAGIWDGVLVIISGVLGAYTVRTRASRIYVILFLISSLINLLTSILLIIYSATGTDYIRTVVNRLHLFSLSWSKFFKIEGVKTIFFWFVFHLFVG